MTQHDVPLFMGGAVIGIATVNEENGIPNAVEITTDYREDFLKWLDTQKENCAIKEQEWRKIDCESMEKWNSGKKDAFKMARLKFRSMFFNESKTQKRDAII